MTSDIEKRHLACDWELPDGDSSIRCAYEKNHAGPHSWVAGFDAPASKIEGEADSATVGPGRQIPEHDNVPAASSSSPDPLVQFLAKAPVVCEACEDKSASSSPTNSPEISSKLGVVLSRDEWLALMREHPNSEAYGRLADHDAALRRDEVFEDALMRNQELRAERESYRELADTMQALAQVNARERDAAQGEFARLMEERNAARAEVERLRERLVVYEYTAQDGSTETESIPVDEVGDRYAEMRHRAERAEAALRRIDNGECPLVENSYGYKADPPDCRIITAAYFAHATAPNNSSGEEK
jgi:hypothetical protein